MKNFELIAKLQALPPELDVALVDYRLHEIMQSEDFPDHSPGIYEQIEVAQQDYEVGGHWISIMFINPMIQEPQDPEEEKKILEPAHGGIILPPNYQE
jgi:hypothetical protein